MQVNGRFSTLALSMSLLSGIFFLIASLKFYHDYHKSNQRELFFFSLSSLLFATASYTFIGSYMWSAEWWFWHFIRLIAFFTLGAIIIIEYRKSYEELLDSESRIRSNQEYFRLLIDSTAEGIFGLDLQSNCTFCNQSGLRMLGYDDESELLGKSMHDMIHIPEPDISTPQAEPCKICEAIRNAFGTHHSDEVFWQKNGSGLNVECWAYPIYTRKKRTGSVVTFFDVTERKRTENLVRENQKKFQDLIELSNDGIYVLQNNRFVFINPMFTQILGYGLDDISGDDFKLESILPEAGLKVIQEREEKSNRGEILSSRYGFKSYTKTREIVDINVSIGDIEWEGAPAVLGIIRDESDHVKHQNELMEALNRVEESQRLKSFFLSNISHELRTPLNAIIGFSDLIRNETQHLIDENMMEFFDIIDQSSSRLLNTVQNILNISLLETGEIDYYPKQTNLVDILERTVKMVKLDADRKNLQFIFTYSNSDIPIVADANILFNALANIIDNAIKYTETGYVTVTLEKKDQFAHVTIADSGVGMSEEYLGNLYDTFSQESQGFNKKYQGIGLGLAIAKRSFDLHNVDVSVESTKGKGTTFMLTFLLSGGEKGAQA